MPLLEVVQNRYVSASIRLKESTALEIDQYAAFIHATADEVLEQALGYVFAKDREFQEFRRSSAAREVPQSLRIRRPASGEQTETPAKKPASVAPAAPLPQAIAVGSKA